MMTLNYVLVTGSIKLVLADTRADSPTNGVIDEIFLGPHNYGVITVPPGIWNGFKGLEEGQSIVANLATVPHDPEEIERQSPHTNLLDYKWDRVDR